jgi:hypothetical protein
MKEIGQNMKTALILVLPLLLVPWGVTCSAEEHMDLFVFEGSWFEMGRQYGENCTHIEEVYDFFVDTWKDYGFTMEALRQEVERYKEYIDREKNIADFMRGIGEGSSLKDDTLLSAYEKVIVINSGFEILWLSDWHHSKKLCTAMGARGNATRNGHTVVGLNRDLPTYPFSYQIAYVLKPDIAPVIFGTVTEGQVASNFQVSSDRLFVGAVKVLGDWSPARGIYECSYGLPSTALMLKMSMCRSVDEALKTLDETQATQGMNYMLADPSRIVVVEKLPFHYALREPEKDVIVLTNQMRADYSYEDGKRTSIPMSERVDVSADPSAEAVEYCYNSAYWALMNNHGRISPYIWMEVISGMHYCYDRDGDVLLEKDGVPVLEAGLTVEYQHYEEGKLTDGTVASHCCDLDTLDIYWVRGLPSRHDQWQKINLEVLKG